MKTLKLQVGKTYRSRKGEVVKIVRKNDKYPYPYQGNNDKWYTESGSFWFSEHSKDLIEEVTATRHTFAIPDGVKEVTVEQVGNRIVVDMVPEKEPKPGDSEFKEGDVVFEDGRVMIVKMYPNLYHAMFYASHLGLHINGKYGIPFTSAAFRLATPEESKLLFDALKKAGKRWNAETMEVEDIPESDRIREWVGANLEPDFYARGDVAKAIEAYLKYREDKK